MASHINHHNHNFGIQKLHGTQNTTKAQQISKETADPTFNTDSTVSFSSNLSAPAPTGEDTHASTVAAQKEATPEVALNTSTSLTRPSYSNSPLTMGVTDVQGIDLNGPDRMGEASIDAPHGLHALKWVGLSGNTRANLNPFGL